MYEFLHIETGRKLCSARCLLSCMDGCNRKTAHVTHHDFQKIYRQILHSKIICSSSLGFLMLSATYLDVTKKFRGDFSPYETYDVHILSTS